MAGDRTRSQPGNAGGATGASPAFGPPLSSWEGLLRWLTIMCAALLLAMALMITFDVVYRALSGRPVVGVFEMTEVMLIGITFLSIAGVQSRGQQLRVDILTQGLVGRKQMAVRLLDGIAASIFFCVLLWTASVDFAEALRLRLSGTGLIRIPTAVPLGLVVFGTVCMLITLVIGISRNVAGLWSGRRAVTQEVPQ
jgi:TRAP-type C4-dicarboxylate transport system permease small subunit